jgi:hypothetical protein
LFDRKLEAKRPLGRPVRISEDNFKLDLRETDRKAWAGLICH